MRDRNARTLLVIEDSEFNREILTEILEAEYFVLQAENGREGFDILKENADRISLILLDIQMPVMDGYEFLRLYVSNPEFSTIPVIVTTGNNSVDEEIRCLEEGASDFVSKPYNTEVVMRRVESMIRLSEASSLLARVEYDSLTGLYTKEFFYEYVRRTLESHPDESFDLLCSNIDSFKMINNRYGMRLGDEMLRYLGAFVKRQLQPSEVAGRIGADVFAVLCRHRDRDEHMEREAEMRKPLSEHAPIRNFTIRYGIYENVDRTLPPEVMCDNANMAIDSIKHHYGEYLAEYDDRIRQKLVREQDILDSMESALSGRQFTVYYQPKHSLRSDVTGGAEALVRWIHPQYGFMNPGEFIPLFESNGFISRLDYYVWETVCNDIRRWKENGFPVVPVSINASRADFYGQNLAQRLLELVDSYGIDHSLIHLEITESIYTDNPKVIIEAVNQLRAYGFEVELDDFGSGYSSLSMLNTLDFDILKLDMSLVRKMETDQAGNSGGIMKFIFELARGLKLQTVAEGVETQAQADRLRSLGCTYAQGYLYSRPVPAEGFEAYLKTEMENNAGKVKSEKES